MGKSDTQNMRKKKRKVCGYNKDDDLKIRERKCSDERVI